MILGPTLSTSAPTIMRAGIVSATLIISKAFSELEEWENVVRAKFPMIEPGTGKVSYPDVKVKEKIMEHHLRLED